MKKRKKNWSVYMVRCADRTLYTGISNDIKRRVKMHNSGKGAKYIVPSRRPVEIVYEEKGFDYGQALKRERKIKDSGKKAKERLALKLKQKQSLRLEKQEKVK
jgi:predicted GIY-YIG superfamily endonuclease